MKSTKKVATTTAAPAEHEVGAGSIGANARQLALIKPCTAVKVPTIGRSRLSDPQEVAQARKDVSERIPDYIERYAEIAQALSNPDWQDEEVSGEFAVLAEAIKRTGSTDPLASQTARRTREVILITAGMAMAQFPPTVTALTYLANHALDIGLLRVPQGPERSLCVEMPTGNPVRPYWTELLCPIQKSAALMATYIAMARKAIETRMHEQQEKIAILKMGMANFLEVMEACEGETVCFVPGNRDRESMWLSLKVEGGYIAVTDAAGSFFAQSLIDQWVPAESIEAGYFHKHVTEGLGQEQIRLMTGLRYSVRDGLVYAMARRDRQLAAAARMSNPLVQAAIAPPPVPTTVPVSSEPPAEETVPMMNPTQVPAVVAKAVNPTNKARRERRKHRREHNAEKKAVDMTDLHSSVLAIEETVPSDRPATDAE